MEPKQKKKKEGNPEATEHEGTMWKDYTTTEKKDREKKLSTPTDLLVTESRPLSTLISS